MKTLKGSMKPSTTDTLVGSGTIIEGKMTSNASVRVDGTVRGDIECKGELYIGESGNLHSNITAACIRNAGKIHGTITTKGMLQITQTGKVYGDIDVASIHIVEGAIFEGTIIMNHPTESGDTKPLPVRAKSESKIQVAK